MNFSNRHRQILELLLGRKDEITASEIAAHIKVSTRTVHRELSELEKELASFGLELHKKSGKGVHIDASGEKLEAMRQLLIDPGSVEYSPDERKVMILCMLLEADEPVKLYSLSHELKVTVPTVTSDLDELENLIHKSGLALVRRKGYGVEIKGAEESKRNLISRLARNHLDDSDLFGTLTENRRKPVTLKLLQMVGKQNMMKVEDSLWQLEEKWLNKLSEGDYTDLLIRVSVAVDRIRRGRRVEGSRTPAEANQDPALRQAVRQLAETLDLSLYADEFAYLIRLLEPKAETDPNRLLLQDDLGLMETVQRLISYIEDKTHIALREDRSLREGLINHMEPALLRMKEGHPIRNPLLAQTRKDYAYLFGIIREAADEILTGIDVPDEEIGFLVMHFGASVERLKQFRRNVRAVLVCTSGIGSSQMLAVRLAKKLPQIEIIGRSSWFEAVRIPEEEYDLIISTVDLPLDPDQYIKLTPLLTEEETERLRHFINEVTLKKKKISLSEAPVPAATVEDWLHSLQAYLNEIVRIMDTFHVYSIERRFFDLGETLEMVCRFAKNAGIIDDVEPIVEILLERERLSSQVIPGTGLALFHTRSERIRIPSFSLFRLRHGLPLPKDTPAQVKHLLLMLGPRELSKESLEVLSEISSLLLVPELVELLETGTQSEIKQFMSMELARFFENKTETGRNTP